MKPAKVPRLVAPATAWSSTDVDRAAPVASIRVARSQALKPPGWLSDMGTSQTPMDAAPATTVTPSRRHCRVEATTGMTASTANDWIIDCRNPARSPRATTAATPCQLPGRARQARMTRSEQPTMSNE